MGTDATIDPRMHAALARLTDNEKECLRRRLQQQTAKEMALELGVSPHAVEKRLKMARTKLGLSSSLEAARLLVAAEEYDRTGPQAADLAAGEQVGKDGFTTATLVGAAAMTILVATAVVLAVSQAGGLSNKGAAAEAATRAGTDASALPPGNVAPSEAEIVHMTQTTFHHVDADNSGYIDGVESPIQPPKGPQPVYRRDEDGNVVPTGETVVHDEDEIRAQFYQRADKDGDGRISYPEFHHWSAPNLVRNGIPAAWREGIRSWMSPEG
jgi:DNA-binding CsgD family transcriptional regulator